MLSLSTLATQAQHTIATHTGERHAVVYATSVNTHTLTLATHTHTLTNIHTQVSATQSCMQPA